MSIEKVSIEEEKEKIKEYFDLFDRDGDGLINASELQEVLFAYEGIKVTDDEVNSFIELYDKNKDGMMDFEEFLLWWTE